MLRENLLKDYPIFRFSLNFALHSTLEIQDKFLECRSIFYGLITQHKYLHQVFSFMELITCY